MSGHIKSDEEFQVSHELFHLLREWLRATNDYIWRKKTTKSFHKGIPKEPQHVPVSQTNDLSFIWCTKGKATTRIFP